MEICSTKIMRSIVFQNAGNIFQERSLQMSLLHGQKANKSRRYELRIGNVCFTNGRMTFWSVKVLEFHDLRKMETN